MFPTEANIKVEVTAASDPEEFAYPPLIENIKPELVPVLESKPRLVFFDPNEIKLVEAETGKFWFFSS